MITKNALFENRIVTELSNLDTSQFTLWEEWGSV